MKEKLRVAIIPANGAFGTAMSVPFVANGHEVTLAFRSEKKAQAFGETRQIERLLGVTFPDSIGFTANTAKAVEEADLLLLAAPASFLKDYYEEEVMPFIREDTRLLCLTKGLVKIENRYLRPSELISDLDPRVARRIAVLSGPNFAGEIARSLPFGTVIASEQLENAEFLARVLRKQIRVYPSNDVIGTELGGAFKNVIAIAAGVNDGRGLGENARSLLIERGVVEVIRLGVASGGRIETLRGLSGAADLWMTGTSRQSRNHEFGYELGQGKDLEELKKTSGTVEGVDTVKVAVELARQYKVETPIMDAVYNVLYEGATIDEAMEQLLKREPTYEDGRPLVFSDSILN